MIEQSDELDKLIESVMHVRRVNKISQIILKELNADSSATPDYYVQNVRDIRAMGYPPCQSEIKLALYDFFVTNYDRLEFSEVAESVCDFKSMRVSEIAEYMIKISNNGVELTH